jgi:hypothetical protein
MHKENLAKLQPHLTNSITTTALDEILIEFNSTLHL